LIGTQLYGNQTGEHRHVVGYSCRFAERRSEALVRATKKCTVVTQKPTTTTTTVVGGDKIYTSQTEAEGAMKTITVCN
jgi:hypothetical protein